jgi:hypothetical protein
MLHVIAKAFQNYVCYNTTIWQSIGRYHDGDNRILSSSVKEKTLMLLNIFNLVWYFRWPVL